MTRRPTLYLETTIPSYLAARPSRDLIVAAHQQLTREWWDVYRHQFNLYVSEAVIREAEAGDQEAAERRLAIVTGLPVLLINDQVTEIALTYATALPIPRQAAVDALHLAYAVAYHMDYLLTWNCKHLAHGEMRRAIYEFNQKNGLHVPTIVTPEELLGRD